MAEESAPRHRKPEYTNHAKKRMQQRGINEDEVEYCIEHFDTSYTDRDGNPVLRVALTQGKCVKVVIKKDSTDPMVVITVADIEGQGAHDGN